MTLERHRSKLIPDVDFSGEGRIFVTDVDGTFPLRHGKKPRDALPKDLMAPNGTVPVPPPDYDTASYRSYDPYRDKARKYKPQKPSNRFGEEVNNLTWGSSGSQSLQRKLRRLRGQGSIEGREGIVHVDPDRRVNRMGTWSSAGKEKKRRDKEQQFPLPGGGYTGNANSLPRGSRLKRASLDMDTIRGYKERAHDRKSSILEMYNRSHRSYSGSIGGKKPLMVKQKRLADDKLPGILFLVCGGIMLALGAAKVLICYWHEYFCILWTGLVVSTLLFLYFNSLRLSIALRCHRTWSTMVQVMGCVLMAYLNQWWNLIDGWGLVTFTWGQHPRYAPDISLLNISLVSTNLRLQPHLPGASELNVSLRSVTSSHKQCK